MGRKVQYRVVMVDPNGQAPVALARAQVVSYGFELNAPGEAKYRIPTLDPQGADAKLVLEREVQIWRDGVLVWWGIPVAYRANLQATEFLAFGLLHYFQRVYFGPVFSNTTNPILTNGNMEANPVTTGWSLSADPTPPTVAPSGLHKYAGSQSIKLTGGGNPANPYYVYQSVFTPSPARSQPVKVTLSAWVYPEGVTAWGFEDRGIELQDSAVTPYNQQWALLNAKVPQNRWTRLETSLLVPAGHVGGLTIALFSPAAGSAYYDQVRATYEQKTGAIEGEDWVDDYLRRIFNYGAGNSLGGSTGPGGSPGAQNAWWGAREYKAPLGMTFYPSLVAAGSLHADTFWNHEDQGNIYDAMFEVVKRDKADFEITWDAAGRTRGLTPYVPRKGSIKRALALELGRNITSFSYDVDGRQSANDVKIVGRNSGDTKEVGQAGGPNPTALGGRSWELVKAAPVEVDGQGLIDYAVAEERRLHTPVIVPTLECEVAGLLDTTNVGGPLTVGDIVPVRMDYGLVQENDLRRVVAMTVTPASETVAIVTNAVA